MTGRESGMNLEKKFGIEGIPNFGAKIYALIAKKAPCIIDIHQQVAQEVSAKISSGRILDAGTGPGYVPFEIAKRAPNLEITGIDLSTKMVDIANKKSAELGFSHRVTFKAANVGNLPFENESFEMVISSLSLHHWAKPVEYIKEIHRVLKNGGQAWIYDIWKDTPKEIEEQVRKKYGWFMGFIFLVVVRSHSSMTLKEAREILSALQVNFREKSVQTQGAVLKLQLVK
jgi:ubiquinone/menaquinone biosynthesis C-methylase UbiE